LTFAPAIPAFAQGNLIGESQDGRGFNAPTDAPE
jgi:hypothetical protein